MRHNKKMEKFESDFQQLSEEGQDYVLAIQQALLFAQKTIDTPPPNNDETTKKGA